ncbi:hypothetical protein QCA50_017777 [Cerrena zonata]|uniref:DNA 3'-5' helicase n=1 Tax=Cerrena zonata TaxID=2478898 RepID=A0AAW0FI30_9APHY
MELIEINASDDYSSLDSLLDFDNILHPDDIPKTIIFGNTRAQVQEIWRYILIKLGADHDYMHSSIAYIHSLRAQGSKDRVMHQFLSGQIKILVATEAVGMGADIPDVERVIQFGLCTSLSVWVQRAGRAGRTPTLKAKAYLLAERSVFQQQRKRTRAKPTKEASEKDNENELIFQPEEGMEFKKHIEISFRNWLFTKDCRRKALDAYFCNPIGLRKQHDSDDCCDNCTNCRNPVSPPSQEEAPPPTFVFENPGDADTNIRHARTGILRNRAIQALKIWRYEEGSSPSASLLLPCEFLLPEKVLKKLAHNADLKTAEAIKAHFPEDVWPLVTVYASNVLQVLEDVDRKYTEEALQQQAQAKAKKTTSLTKCTVVETDFEPAPMSSLPSHTQPKRPLPRQPKRRKVDNNSSENVQQS